MVKLLVRSMSYLMHIVYVYMIKGNTQDKDKTTYIHRLHRTVSFRVMSVKRHFQKYFSYIVRSAYNGGGNQIIRRKPSTYRKSLINCIT